MSIITIHSLSLPLSDLPIQRNKNTVNAILCLVSPLPLPLLHLSRWKINSTNCLPLATYYQVRRFRGRRATRKVMSSLCTTYTHLSLIYSSNNPPVWASDFLPLNADNSSPSAYHTRYAAFPSVTYDQVLTKESALRRQMMSLMVV